MTKNQMNNKSIIVIQTELPTFVLEMFNQRNETPIENINCIHEGLLDVYGDALNLLFKRQFLSMGIVSSIEDETIEHSIDGYSLEIKRKLKHGQIAEISFFQIQPNLVPITIDLITLYLTIISSQPTIILPTVDTLYNLLNSIITLNRDKGQADLIDIFEAHILIQKEKKPNLPTMQDYISHFSDWSPDRLHQGLTILENLKILKPISDKQFKFDTNTPWKVVL